MYGMIKNACGTLNGTKNVYCVYFGLRTLFNSMTEIQSTIHIDCFGILLSINTIPRYFLLKEVRFQASAGPACDTYCLVYQCSMVTSL